MLKGKNYHIVIGILLLGAVFYFFSSARETKIANYPSSGTDIIAFGDSLIVGAGATYGNDFVSLLSKKIGQEIINSGASGDTTDDGLARLNELDRYRPRVVLVLFGGNDKFMADAIHPNDAGNAIIAERIYPILAPLLK